MPGHLGLPVWVDDPDFDLDYHVRRSALPAPGHRRPATRARRAAASPRQLDRSRPLWEIYLVEGLSDGRFAVVTKTHHAMVDGLASIDVGAILLDLTPNRASRRPTTGCPPPEPSGARARHRRRRRGDAPPADGARHRARAARGRRAPPYDRRDDRRWRSSMSPAAPRGRPVAPAQRRDRRAAPLRASARTRWPTTSAVRDGLRRHRQRRRARRRHRRAAALADDPRRAVLPEDHGAARSSR